MFWKRSPRSPLPQLISWYLLRMLDTHESLLDYDELEARLTAIRRDDIECAMAEGEELTLDQKFLLERADQRLDSYADVFIPMMAAAGWFNCVPPDHWVHGYVRRWQERQSRDAAADFEADTEA